MVGAYKPVAEFIKLVAQGRIQPGVRQHLLRRRRSALAKELGADGKGVIVSQVVPFPWDASLKVVADYQAAIKAADPKAEPEFVSLEGYLVGRLAIAALEKAGKDLTREGFLKAIKETGKFDIGGLPMTFGPDNNEGLDKVFMTIIQADGTFKADREDGQDVEQLSSSPDSAVPHGRAGLRMARRCRGEIRRAFRRGLRSTP